MHALFYNDDDDAGGDDDDDVMIQEHHRHFYSWCLITDGFDWCLFPNDTVLQ